MDRHTKSDLDKEFPRPMPHPKFVGWAALVGLAGVYYWQSRINGIGPWQSVAYWVAIAVVFCIVYRKRWIR
jgi:hypothetical protein